MTEATTTASIVCIREKERTTESDVVAIEFPLTIILNGEELATTLCSPAKMEQLAIGFLSSEGLIRAKEDIKKIQLNQKRGSIRVDTVAGPSLETDLVFKRFITSGCGKGAALYSYADALNQTNWVLP